MASTETDELNCSHTEATNRRLWNKAIALSRGDEARAIEYVQYWTAIDHEPLWSSIKGILDDTPLPKNMVN